MARFILLTFAFLGWAFYEMSGGAGFQPANDRVAEAKTDPLKASVSQTSQESAENGIDVTRVSLDLTTVHDAINTNDQGREVTSKPLSQIDTAQKATNIQAVDTAPAVIIPSLIPGADAQAMIQPAAIISTASSAAVQDIRVVKGNRVNVRGGPSKSHQVVGRLTRGTQVEILEDAGNGWVRLQDVDGTTSGWMADFLLTSG